MRDDLTLPWPEYLRAWLGTLRYHPDRHRFADPQQDEASPAPDGQASEPPPGQDRAA